MEERRLLVAVALSLVILTGYSYFFGPKARPPEPQASPAAEGAAETGAKPAPVTPPPPGATPVAVAESSAEIPAETPAEPVPAVAAELEQRVEVESAEYSIAFTNRGARLLSWKLAGYLNEEGRPEEMVPARARELRPLDVETGDAIVDERLREALFRPSTTRLRVAGESPSTLTFEYADAQIQATKSLSFEGSDLVSVTVTVASEGRTLPARLVWGPGLGDEAEAQGYEGPQGVAMIRGEVERVPPGDLEAGGRTEPAIRWAGVEGRFFAALMIPSQGQASAVFRPVLLAGDAEEEPESEVAAAVDVSPGAPLLLYVGAKDHEALHRLGYGLEKVVPVGDWIGPIVVPLMRLLRWVHGQVGNWGWAIVILTLMINVIMAPLRHYSIANGMKMAKMQPEMKVIQERYRKIPMMDPRRQKMQEEMGVLYARHGMSMGTQMLVGCLPLLLTMPFLFAFYRMLMISVELRGASFLWIPDLSQKDPWFITPLAMGVSMFAMQKMTPSTMDPAQQRIMMLMPVVLTVMFVAAPAGLNLYWLTANIWSLFQQTVEMRVLKPKEPSPAAKKDRKKERKKR